ncbi:MAG: FtsX-like permease family protein [Clostridiaceae bacterium]|nr:FtsX-like permease family protein [Clostridiaceae bacterium]
MTKALIKDTLRSITANKLRFLSIAVIVALGMSFFVGIKSASPAMQYEANEYFVKNNLMDVHVTSPIPFSDEDIERIANVETVSQVVGSCYVDGYAALGKETFVNKNGTELICRISLIDADKAQKFLDGEEDPTYINRLDLKEGRLPEKSGECVVDEKSAELYPEIEIGKTLNISETDGSSEISLKNNKFSIVGIVASPEYISVDKGQTKLGSGSLDSSIYVLKSDFATDKTNELFVKMNYSEYLDSFSEIYIDRAIKLAEEINKVSEAAIDSKLSDLKTEYNHKIEDKKSEIIEYTLLSDTQLKEKEASIKEFKQYVDNEDKILQELKEENESKIKSASSTLSSLEKQLTTLNSSYESHVKLRDSQSSEIKGYSELKKLYDDLNAKHMSDKANLDTLEGNYQKKKSELESKNKEISEREQKISDYQTKIERLTSEISELERTISSLNTKISEQNEKIKTQNALISSINSDIQKQNAIINGDYTNAEKLAAISEKTKLNNALSEAQNELTSRNNELKNLQSQLSSAQSSKTKKESEKSQASSSLSSERTALATAKSQKELLQTEYTNAKNNYNSAKKSYDADSATLSKYMTSMNELTKGQSSLTKLIAQTEAEQKELESLKIKVTEAQISYTLASRNSSLEIEKAEYDLKVAKSRYGTVDDEYTELKNEIENKKQTLNNELKSYETTLGNLTNLRWTATPRNSFAGIDSFSVSLENIKSVATFFPMVFFMTAMLACFVIMVKNVEEERKEIGVFKAFGYSNSAIIGKFLIYAIMAWAIGVFVGSVMGTCVLPFIVCSIYNETYSVPNVGTVFLSEYVFFGVALSFVMTAAAAVFAVLRELKNDSASLMRPQNVNYNRRNLLEKIPALWGKMSYGMVIVARTISRSRERVMIGTLGIACCTALILSSLGLINSTTAVSGAQYNDDGIFKYDIMFVLKTPQQEDAQILKDIQEDQRTENAALFSKRSAYAAAENKDTAAKRSVNVISLKDSEEFPNYVNIEVTDGSFDLSSGNAVITDKMANDLDISVGDNVWLTTSDTAPKSARVGGIVKNYTNHYIYMAEDTYSDVFDAEPQYKYIIVSTKSYVEKQDIENLASTFLKEDIVTGASTASEMADSVDVSISRIFAVVMLFVISACLLAMIVMYTNSNVNLSERTREIANIKVIGLSDHEVLIYVIRENIISTVLGTVIGLVAGIFLHSVLMGFISVDNVVYGSSISWWSYIVTMAIIVLISLISALPIKFKIDRIDMAQTLKEIE